MENFREFAKDPKHKNWFKGVMALKNLQKLLEPFIDEEIAIFHRELRNECGPDHCVKKCDLRNWKPQPNQIPPLNCEVCSRWRKVIWTNITSKYVTLCWSNSKPHLWSTEKWEVAKVYMPGGHKDHNSVGDFDIAARLRLMRQCKHFKKFKLGGLCDKVSKVRNDIMHSPMYQLEQKDLHDYLSQIRELGEKLARYDPKFKNLSEDIDQIQNLDFRLILPDDIAAQTNRAKDEKELEDLLFAVAQEAADHHVTRMELEKLKIQVAQQKQDKLIDYYDLRHKPRGLCVIINNEVFLGPFLYNRPGSRQDEKSLRTVFTSLGFYVVTRNNLTAEDMRRELQQLGSRNFLDDDALVVCVLSHGLKGCVFGTDGQKVELKELTKPFTSIGAPTLAGKPKLFFIQACQESVYQSGPVSCPVWPRPEMEVRRIRLGEDAGREDAGHPGFMLRPLRPRQEEWDRRGRLEEDAGPVCGESVPWDADFLLGMAAVPESRSFRNPVKGSIYIQELCAQLTRAAESSGKADILDVLTRVNREVSQQEFFYYKQMPEPKNTLTKKLVLKFV